MSTDHQLWEAVLQARVIRLRDWTRSHGEEWRTVQDQVPGLAAEIDHLLAVFNDAPRGQRFR